MLLMNTLRYKHWADDRTLEAAGRVEASRFPAEDAFIRQQLNHMVRVEENFRARLSGGLEPYATSNSEPAEVPALAGLAARLQASNAWLLAYAEQLDAAESGEIVRFRFVDGKKGAMSREEILFHLVNHGSYHRGAIGRALDQCGGLRPADTYTVFIHAAEPARRSGS